MSEDPWLQIGNNGKELISASFMMVRLPMMASADHCQIFHFQSEQVFYSNFVTQCHLHSSHHCFDGTIVGKTLTHFAKMQINLFLLAGTESTLHILH